MWNTSSQFNQVATASMRRTIAHITIGGTDVSADLFSIDYAHECDSIIGGFHAKSIELELVGSAVDLLTLKGQAIEVSLALDGAEDIVPLGVYFADMESVELDEVRNRVSIIAFDDTLRFDRGWVAPPTWPQSQQALVSYVATKCGVTYAGSLPTLEIAEDLWAEDTVSYRQVIADIAEANQLMAWIDREGELDFIDALSATQSVAVEPKSYVDLTMEAEQAPIDGVILQGEGSEDNLSKPANAQLISDNALTITANRIIEHNRSAHLDRTHARLDGFAYQPYSLEYFARPDIDVGDRITITDTKGVVHETSVSAVTLTWRGGLRGTLACPILPETAERYELAGVEQSIAENRRKVKGLKDGLTAYEQTSAKLFESLSRMLGVHRTIDEAPEGGEIYYWHDRETLEESDIVWRQSADAFMWSRDGGLTWSGVDAETDTVTAMVVSALEINANKIRVSSDKTLDTELTEIDTLQSELTQAVQGGGVNLALNSDVPVVAGQQPYKIKTYTLSEDLVVGQQYSALLRGDFNDGQQPGAWQNSVATRIMSFEKIGDRLWVGTGRVVVQPTAGEERFIHVYNFPSATREWAEIDWITFVKGGIPPDRHTRAPEDIEADIESVRLESANALDSYAQTVTAKLTDLQGQVDGSISTWFFDTPPDINLPPSSEWQSADEMNRHLGDLYYDRITGYVYRWRLHAGNYAWERITDTDVTKALADAAKAQDTADNKRRVFWTEPQPPYDRGDLWTQGTDGDLMRAIAGRQTGSHQASDWVKAVKYTDDSRAVAAENAAKAYAEAQVALEKARADAYADGIVSAEEQARIDQAEANLAEAKAYAEQKAQEADDSARGYADLKKQEADQAAQDYADAQIALEQVRADAYADGKVSAEEQARIDDAEAKLAEAKSHAEAKAQEAKDAAQVADAKAEQALEDAEEADIKATAVTTKFTQLEAGDLRLGQVEELDGRIDTTEASIAMVEGQLDTRVTDSELQAMRVMIDDAIAGKASASDIQAIEAIQASMQMSVEEWQVTVDQISAQQEGHAVTIDDVKNYMRFSVDGLELGHSASTTILRASNDRIEFIDGGQVTAYFTGQTLYINSMTVLAMAQIGNHVIAAYPWEVDGEKVTTVKGA